MIVVDWHPSESNNPSIESRKQAPSVTTADKRPLQRDSTKTTELIAASAPAP